MRLIINSYLKTFLKTWVSTVGILLFIIMLGAVVLGMMTTPLQLSLRINNVKRQTTQYDYRIEDGNSYTDDFAYHYFLLNGDKYTTEVDGTTVLKSEVDFAPIAPSELEDKIKSWKEGNDLTTKTLLSKSSYLFLDETMSKIVEGSPSDDPVLRDLTSWEAILNPETLENPDLTPAGKQYIGDLLKNLANFINTLIFAGQESANQNLQAGISLTENKDAVIKVVVTDLIHNLKDQVDNYFSEVQQLYIANNFLKVNLGTNFQPITTLDQLESRLKESTLEIITLTGIITLDANFRSIIANHHANSVNAYLLDNIFRNEKNKNSVNQNGQLAYLLATSIEYNLVRTKTGSLTPDFSVDVRTATMDQKFNQLFLEDGSLPSWNNLSTPEIVLNSGFMKLNHLKINDLISLPTSTFGQNIDKNKDPTSWMVANDIKFRIVGTGSRYDELTPGKGFTSFVQKLDSYTYAYLPADFTAAYKKTSFAYGDTSKKTYSPKISFRIKNQNTILSPRAAFDINSLNSESVFADNSTLIQKFSDLMTILKLNNINIQVIIYNVLGLLCLILAFIFINFTIKKEINETRRQLGIFKSFGYKTSELSLIFSVKTLITILIGMLIGWFCSFPVQIYMGMNFESSVIFSYQSIYFNPVLIVGIFLIVPGLFMLISYLITLKYLNESALSLITNGNRIAKHNPKMGWISRNLEKKNKGFNYRLRRSFVNRTKGKFAVVQILFGFSALLYALMFGAQALMYQAIEQGFGVLKDDTDHEYQWQNRGDLVINQTTNNKYSLDNIENYDNQKIDYIDYQGYANPNEAILNQSELKEMFSDARYRFRVLTEAMANSLTNKNVDPDDTDNWILLPRIIAEKKFASNPDSDNLLNVNYFLYKLITFKGLKKDNTFFETYVSRSIEQGKPFWGDLNDLMNSNLKNMWLDSGDLIKIGLGTGGDVLKQTLFGMIDNDETEYNISNNLFITDLSRIFSMIFAEQYVTNLLQQKLQKLPEDPNNPGKWTKEQVDEALKTVYGEALYKKDSPLFGYDPRDERYWNVSNNPLLNFNFNSSEADDGNPISGLGDLLNNLPPSLLGLFTAAMLAKENNSLTNETVLTFNKLFYDSSQEHLQLGIDVLPTNDYDVGPMNLTLIDVANEEFGDARREYNFANVSDSEYRQLTQKSDEPNTFYGIVPYAVAQRLKLKKGDVLPVLTNTQTKEEIKIIVAGINKSITMPISLSWNVMVDYSTFAKSMFSDELQTAIGLNESDPEKIVQPYLFNSLLSQKLMLTGKINLKNLPESIKSFKFFGDSLTINLEKDSVVLGGMLSSFLIDFGYGDIFAKNGLKVDLGMNLATNPMMMSPDNNDIVAIPYNILRIGVHKFTKMMNELMAIFLTLQSILLTIILVVIMNIIVDEFAVVILTLRSLGYLQSEINWIVMGSYVIGTIISYAIAYVLSLVLWKVFLIVAANLWNIYVFLPFDWHSLVIPFLVLGSIMFIGWMASNYQVNRRELTQITSFV